MSSKLAFTSVSEQLGLKAGKLLGSLTGLISYLRRSRMFHPRGITFQGRLEPIDSGIFDAGIFGGSNDWSVQMRLSSAWWKSIELPDVLGIALRIFNPPLNLDQAQDLLFATIKHPWTMPFAPLTTSVHDFMNNTYYAVSPFQTPCDRRAMFRLVPQKKSQASEPGSRAEKFTQIFKEGRAEFALEAQSDRFPSWTPIAKIQLTDPWPVDQEALSFSPFRNGLKIVPKGFIQYLRVGAYRASQAARPR